MLNSFAEDVREIGERSMKVSLKHFDQTDTLLGKNLNPLYPTRVLMCRRIIVLYLCIWSEKETGLGIRSFAHSLIALSLILLKSNERL